MCLEIVLFSRRGNKRFEAYQSQLGSSRRLFEKFAFNNWEVHQYFKSEINGKTDQYIACCIS